MRGVGVIALLLVAAAHADQPCAVFTTPADVVEAAMRVQGARTAGAEDQPELRALTMKLACVSEPLTPEDASAVHLALTGSRLSARPAPTPDDAETGPPHPPDGVALVDGQAYAALRPGRPALVQAFDADGHVVYTRFLDAAGVKAVREGAPLPTSPTVPRLAPVPLRPGEITRLVASSALMVASGVMFGVAAEARSDWYALNPSPVSTVTELEQLRNTTNITQGAAIGCAALGAAGLLSVAVRVPF